MCSEAGIHAVESAIELGAELPAEAEASGLAATLGGVEQHEAQRLAHGGECSVGENRDAVDFRTPPGAGFPGSTRGPSAPSLRVMRKIVQRSLGIAATSFFVAVGCGDDDDSSPNSTGGAGGQSTGGSSAKGGAGAATGGASTGGKSTGGATTGGTNAGGMTVGGGGAGGSPDTTECEVIGELCHAADDGDGPLHDCHELGHSNDPAVCRERFGSCITQCLAVDDGHGGAGGGGGVGGAAGAAGAAGAGGHGGHTQSPYCLALGELCHPVSSVSAALQECHELGHIGDAAVCEAQFTECATQCLAAREAAEGAGGASAGGAGGMSSGGASGGGAGGSGG